MRGLPSRKEKVPGAARVGPKADEGEDGHGSPDGGLTLRGNPQAKDIEAAVGAAMAKMQADG